MAWAEPKSWQFNASGQWTEAQTRSVAPALAPNPLLDRAQHLLDTRQYEQGHDLLVGWLKANPKAPDRDRAEFILAQIYYAMGDRLWCFYQCDEILDKTPDSKVFYPALELQYRVADDYLRGYKKRFLGLAIVPMDDTAIEMLFRIQERAPGSPIAERALLRTASFYYRTSQFDLSADAYGAFLRLYPRSPEVPRARLRQAYSNFAQFRGAAYDATPLLDARAEFQDIQGRTPELARDEGVQQFIDRIDEQLAAKLYIDGQFYLRVHHPKAAVFLFRSLIQRYPTSRDADAARKVLQRLPASALSDPPPPASAGQIPMPTTRPVLGPVSQ